MNTPIAQQLLLRFAQLNLNPLTATTMATLSSEVHSALWGADDGGDLYIAGIALIQAIGRLKNPAAYAMLLEHFPEWWELDLKVARVIASALDAKLACNEVKTISVDLDAVRTWLDEDDMAMQRLSEKLTWAELIDHATRWMQQDAEYLRETIQTWSSAVPAEVFSYHQVIPITSSHSLADYGLLIDKSLVRRDVLDKAIAGSHRLFAVEELLKPALGPVAVISVEKTDAGWRALHVRVKRGQAVPQRLYQLAYAVAARYETKVKLASYASAFKKTKAILAIESLLPAILGTSERTSQLKPPAQVPTPVASTTSYLYIDTCTLLCLEERIATRALALATEQNTQIVFCGDTVRELEQIKQARPEMRREVNAALRMIEEFQSTGKGVVDTTFDSKTYKPYADDAILRGVHAHVARNEAVTVVTADTALRVHLRTNNPRGLLSTVDSRALIERHSDATPVFPRFQRSLISTEA